MVSRKLIPTSEYLDYGGVWKATATLIEEDES